MAAPEEPAFSAAASIGSVSTARAVPELPLKAILVSAGSGPPSREVATPSAARLASPAAAVQGGGPTGDGPLSPIGSGTDPAAALAECVPSAASAAAPSA